MTSQRRAFLIFISVLAGTLLSAGMIYLKRGSLKGDDLFLLITNFAFAILIIAGIGYILIWRKK